MVTRYLLNPLFALRPGALGSPQSYFAGISGAGTAWRASTKVESRQTPLQGLAPAPGRRRAKVAVVKVDHDDLDAAWRNALQVLPGLVACSLPRQVVIKPNLCDIAAWETGVTTDPRWVGLLARELREIRPDVEIRIVESDAVSAYKTYRSCDETFERLGYVHAAQEAGVELVNLSRQDTIEIRLSGIPFPVRIPELPLEPIYFISIANLKVHAYTRMTGILKNSLGLLSDADISSFHPYLSALISGLHRLCPPDLCIIDGRIGLEGNGPIIGCPVRLSALLLGNDALAVDEAACALMGFRPRDVPYLRQTAKDLGRKFGQFQLVGELRPHRFAFEPGSVHRGILLKFAARRFEQRLHGFVARWIDRGVRFGREPLAFTKSAISKLMRGLRAG